MSGGSEKLANQSRRRWCHPKEAASMITHSQPSTSSSGDVQESFVTMFSKMKNSGIAASACESSSETSLRTRENSRNLLSWMSMTSLTESSEGS
eukprot:14218533-Heterocapsa_arctica.AAC.1